MNCSSFRIALRGAAVAVAVLAGFGTTGAAAEIVVLQSTAPGLQAGKELKDADRLVVPAGKSAVVMLPSGATRTIAGPYDKPVGDLTRGITRNDDIVDQVRKIVTSPGRDSVVGATRTAKPAGGGRTVDALPFSWTEIPVTAQGDHCVARNATLSVTRGGGSATTVGIVDVHTGSKAEIRFADGQTAQPWPSQIALKAGTFAFLAAGQPMRQVRIRFVSPLPDRDETLRVLHGQRCEAQMQAWIRTGLLAGTP